MGSESRWSHWLKLGLTFCVGLTVGLLISFSLSESIAKNTNLSLNKAWNSRSLLNNQESQNHRPEVNIPPNSPLSHQDVDWLNQMTSFGKPAIAREAHNHTDNEDVGRDLYNKVRIMCWVMTGGENHRKKADHVMVTWGKRCNKILFMSDTDDEMLPVVKFNVGHGRDHLTAKTMHAFQYSYKHHINDLDWFLKVDDDTYVILENLRYMLSDHNTTEPVFFGHHFKTIVKQGYFSGGGGYVLSKEALMRFSRRKPGQCSEDGGAEDVELGRCMEKLGVKTGDSRDALGRSRFHCFDPETFIHGNYPDWYLQYDKYGAKKGLSVLSDYAITFHYIPVNKMYNLEYYIYHLRPYGVQYMNQERNITKTADTQRSLNSTEPQKRHPSGLNKTQTNPDIQTKIS